MELPVPHHAALCGTSLTCRSQPTAAEHFFHVANDGACRPARFRREVALVIVPMRSAGTTGTRVPLKTQAPPTRAGSRSTAAQEDQSSDKRRAGAHSACLSMTTCETLATERPEPTMKLSNRAPELRDRATKNRPRYCQRLDAFFMKTGMALRCRANSALTVPVRAPWPHRTTSGA